MGHQFFHVPGLIKALKGKAGTGFSHGFPETGGWSFVWCYCLVYLNCLLRGAIVQCKRMALYSIAMMRLLRNKLVSSHTGTENLWWHLLASH